MGQEVICKLCERTFVSYKSLKLHHEAKHSSHPLPKPPKRKLTPSYEESEADRHIDYLIFGRSYD
jgi:hypothetical protein